MKLIKAKLVNIKSYYPAKNVCLEKDINIFVGTNAGGKSNLFEVLQGVINTLVFKHVTIPSNPNWHSPNNPDSSKPFNLVFDVLDNINLKNNILDPHFNHKDEESVVEIVFEITQEDIDQINYVISNKEAIITPLLKSVTNSDGIINLLRSTDPSTNFSQFVGRPLALSVKPNNIPNITINDYSGYDTNQIAILNCLFDFIQHRNVFHELSLIIPNLETSPATRYFGPHRILNQPQNQVFVDLSAIGNFEDTYAKSINQNKENSYSFIDGSFNKLCYLYKSNKNEIINSYKNYLAKYLKVNVEISIVEHPTKYIYEIKFTKSGNIPMKLSSGEKEFFNLISGLILTGIRNGTVLIDEPELHLHFQWQQAILKLINDLSRDFNIQFLIVTHSPKFINQQTLPKLHRVFMKEDLCSYIIKPADPLADSDKKDLVKFINTTNNEKVFFTQKVVLVEGLSDLIMYSSIVEKLKEELHSELEVELVEAGSKNNLFRFRKLLNEWEIENYLITDLDFLINIKKNRKEMILDESVKQLLENLNDEISNFIVFSEDKLKDILCSNPGKDAESIVNLIKNRKSLSDGDFIDKFSKICDYLIEERAVAIQNAPVSGAVCALLDLIAEKEGILVLKGGNLENLFPELNVSINNKVSNALVVSEKIVTANLPDYLRNYFIRILS